MLGLAKKSDRHTYREDKKEVKETIFENSLEHPDPSVLPKDFYATTGDNENIKDLSIPEESETIQTQLTTRRARK